jgi:hypothetical protein
VKARSGILAVMLSAITFAMPAIAGETPKYGGTLTYMIPADAPPSFDGHRESTYATVHSVAGFVTVTDDVRTVSRGLARRHAAATASCHCAVASARRFRRVARETRWR